MKTNYSHFFFIASILLYFLFFGFENLLAQSVNRALRKAEHAHFKGDEHKAQELFKDVIQKNPNSAKANYWYGRYMLENPRSTHKDSAYIYMEKAMSLLGTKNPKILDKHFYLYMGKAYQHAYKFDKAIEMYDKELSTKHGLYPHIEQEAQLGKAQCQNAKDLQAKTDTSKKYDIINLGDKVNSPYADYTPVVVPGSETILFNARKPTNLGKPRGEEKEYSEDIQLASRKGDNIQEWKEEAKRLELPKVNNKNHEAVVTVSHDGKKIFLYTDAENGNIYEADLVIDPKAGQEVTWGELKPIKEINTNNREPSLCVSPGNSVIIFSSDRKGGKGGLDLWYMKKVNGVWQPPVNCEKLNTEYDEDAPYITRDGKYLYFSARGTRSVGGFDIFKVSIDTTAMTFGEVQNIGFPINSVGDDIYIFTEAGDTSGYFTSSRDYGFGEKDNYYFKPKRIPKKEQQNLLAYEQLGSLRGVIIDEATGDPIYNALVKIDGTPFSAQTDKDGRYEIVNIPPGEYQVKYNSEGYEGKKLDIIMPEGKDVFLRSEMFFDQRLRINDDVVANVALKKLQQGQNLTDVATTLQVEANKVRDILIRKYPDMFKNTLKNDDVPKGMNEEDKQYLRRVYFNFYFDKTVVVRGLKVKLDSITSIMNKYPNLRLIVYGHCDTVGTADYNMDLGNRRANTVIQYLKEKGIPENRMTPVSHGFNKPIQSNRTQAGRDANRRVDFGYENSSTTHTLKFSRPLIVETDKTIDTIVMRMKLYPNSTIQVTVHSEIVEQNMKAGTLELSKKRAEAIKAMLTERGIEASRISADGLGDTQPLENATTLSANFKNKRIDFVITHIIEDKGVKY